MTRSNKDLVQATFLNDLRKQRMSVVVYLVTGVGQAGKIDSFDQHAVLLRHGDSVQLIYKHMISSIMPGTKPLPALASSPVQRTVKRPDANSVPVVTRKVSRRTIVRDE
ncbi:RNA chaperone Hfq [Noviherbaspirillum sp. CPCC 100848]|uniref:RNA chaperone Hfq n=1 Tax=Noviherbaspirillum album TaxID=3080276 RepID=A0ABU6JJB9_9BURK|nr:RNA chaperone Hfq [Noviherbaspirillum sp. CPCC 100848]MEC4723754.1 RNA chaperone Hfq [Noviherbaspirillum sp. CPCC 100848]